jgi:predicted amidophosphoribosyltransferase
LEYEKMTEETSQTVENHENVEEIAGRIERRFESFHRFIVVCGDCQSEMPADWHYCSDCGSRLSTECPACQQPLPPIGARFCPHCGFAIPRIAPFGQEADVPQAGGEAR